MTASLKRPLSAFTWRGGHRYSSPPLGPEPRSGYFPAYQAETANEPELQPMANEWRENYSPRRAGRCHRSDAWHAPARGRDYEANPGDPTVGRDRHHRARRPDRSASSRGP